MDDSWPFNGGAKWMIPWNARSHGAAMINCLWTPQNSLKVQRKTQTGWWLGHPSEKYYIVNWDDYSQYMGKKECSEPPTSKQWLGSCLNDAVYPTAAMAVLLLPISPLRPFSPCCPSSQGGGSTRSDAHLEVPTAITLKGDRF